MLECIVNWRGAVVINGTTYPNISEARTAWRDESNIKEIRLLPNVPAKVAPVVLEGTTEYKITVRPYMTRTATPEFDFMQKWNKNIPMPFLTMIGTVEKETRGMVYMKLHADIYAPVIQTCMKCGRPITNKISQYFGVGPICGGHNYVNPFNSEEELQEAVGEYRKKLQNITWEGWIIKSAIIEKEEV